MQCPHCQHEIPDGSLVCPACGGGLFEDVYDFADHKERGFRRLFTWKSDVPIAASETRPADQRRAGGAMQRFARFDHRRITIAAGLFGLVILAVLLSYFLIFRKSPGERLRAALMAYDYTEAAEICRGHRGEIKEAELREIAEEALHGIRDDFVNERISLTKAQAALRDLAELRIPVQMNLTDELNSLERIVKGRELFRQGEKLLQEGNRLGALRAYAAVPPDSAEYTGALRKVEELGEAELADARAMLDAGDGEKALNRYRSLSAEFRNLNSLGEIQAKLLNAADTGLRASFLRALHQKMEAGRYQEMDFLASAYPDLRDLPEVKAILDEAKAAQRQKAIDTLLKRSDEMLADEAYEAAVRLLQQSAYATDARVAGQIETIRRQWKDKLLSDVDTLIADKKFEAAKKALETYNEKFQSDEGYEKRKSDLEKAIQANNKASAEALLERLRKSLGLSNLTEPLEIYGTVYEATVISPKGLNVRNLPSTKGMVIGTLAQDEKVKVLGRSNADRRWYWISYGSHEDAYICAQGDDGTNYIAFD